MHILSVVGARPNLPKIAPLMAELQHYSAIKHTIVHTGQHYHHNMSQIFFDELALPQPDVHLGIGSGSHATQTGQIMIAFTQVLRDLTPDIVVVVGDVNSTLACALTAAMQHIPVAHIEAGLRSFNRTMPEEINRRVTDAVSDFLFTPSWTANAHLQREGVSAERIFCVGNIMIDTLRKHYAPANALHTPARFGVEPGNYALLSLHRPANVDDPTILGGLLAALQAIQHDIPVLFPVHPRTKQRLDAFGFHVRLTTMTNLRMVEPQGYLTFLDLLIHARLVLTDSGGIQAETTVLGVPCLTLRQETEYTETLTIGTNELVGVEPAHIVAATRDVLAGCYKVGRVPLLWDGHTAQRIVAVLRRHLR